MVNSIASIVQTLIDKDISIQDSLQRGYGNYSAIARMLKPQVEEILDRKVKVESIITSVKRAKMYSIVIWIAENYVQILRLALMVLEFLVIMRRERMHVDVNHVLNTFLQVVEKK